MRLEGRSAALALGAILVGTAVMAGCASPLSKLTAGAASSGAAAKAAEMLKHVPGYDVQPTGHTKEFTLYLHRMTHEMYPGSTMQMWGFSLSDDPKTAMFPGPELRVEEGDKVVVHFRPLVAGYNHTIHWHGQNVPYVMDGVPYLSQEPVEAGKEFTYVFNATPAGTYWYHCHVDTQHHLDMGMYGALIVTPQDPASDPPFDAEYTMFLDEMDKYHIEGGNPQQGNEPQSGDPYDWLQYVQRQSQDVVNRNAQIQQAITGTPIKPARDWWPVTYPAYKVTLNTFLINGVSFPFTEPVMIKDGSTLRIRLIDAGDMVHAMHLHGHHFLVTHKDGVLLDSPYWADTLLIAPGERYDVYVVGNNPGIWDFHDHINANTQDDSVWPGGMMTQLVYASLADKARHGHAHNMTSDAGFADLSLSRDSGAYTRWYNQFLP